ncbi:DUF2225 domain-containing protein [Breznakiella homolactica]|uniref:DUF2225 domain-containing protein n=1 Tax=Breznakiella homolactica TaxID=2798577 RepID=A0A7T8B8K7_9SPIR|nr:DUF2225 domain-containing protein [Breznakiella homolactica]QQO07472.1 DUF2225 domain-containing protein [Breznakiella homolactica]
MMDIASFEDREVKATFLSKDEVFCPVCSAAFRREELLTGGGRLIAGAITDELHRLYEPSVKYGDVYPLAYPVTVCPECWFAAMDKDFTSLPDDDRERILGDQEQRMAEVANIFPAVDFSTPRDLIDGAASHYLALRCYGYFPKDFSPTIKQGICAIRAGWLFDEMQKKYPDQNFDWLALLFKKKAQFLYSEAVYKEQSGKEPLSGIKNFGPDTDKNYGYEGALYLSALLQLKYGPREDSNRRIELLGESKRTIAKIFGLGKSSKTKPGPLLEHARNLYDTINKELNETDD